MEVLFLDLKVQYPKIKDEIKAEINGVLESQQFILGPKVQQFESEIATYCQVKHAIGVASGSDALLLALMAINVAPGDEVITTPYTFFSTAGAISRLGAKPVFVDIDPKTYNINPDRVEATITNKTKARQSTILFRCIYKDVMPIWDIKKAIFPNQKEPLGKL